MTIYTGASLAAFASCAVLAPLVLLTGRRNKQTFLFGILTLLAGIWSIFPFLLGTARSDAEALALARLIYVAALLVPPVFLHLTFSLLDLPKTSQDRLWLNACYVLTFLFLPLLPTDAFISGTIRFAPHFGVVPGIFYTSYVAFFGATCGVGFIRLLGGYRNASGIRRNQLRYIFVSWFFAYLAGLLHFLPSYIGIEPFPHDLLLIAFVTISAYAIVRHRLLDIRIAVTRTAVFMAVYSAVLGLPLLAALSWQTKLESVLGAHWWAFLWLACAVLATGAHYVNLYLRERAEGRLLAEQRRYQAILRQASQGMTLIKDLQRLVRLIVHLLTRKVRLRHAAIYLWDQGTRRYEAKAARQYPIEKPPTFAEPDPLSEYLRWHHKPLVTEELQLRTRWGEKELQPVVAALKSMAAAVLVPSYAEERCKGFLILGEKATGALYTTDDLQVFEVLASQAALAIENAEFYEELKRTQADLFQTAKMASLGHMAGGMSHQINNRFHVLTILAGTLKSIMKDQDPAAMPAEQLHAMWQKALETLTKLEDNALRGGDIVKTLLRFSRPAGEYKAVTVPQILQTAKEVAQFRVDLANVDLTEQVSADLPPVKGDLNQLADCCFNLMSNAYDAILKKAGMIQANQIAPGPDDPSPFKARLWVRASVEKKEDQTFVVLDLQDNGIGMTPEELEGLFVPFFTTKATAQKGTGLGLYVIQRIIERHGGTINASSQYGVGTTFSLRIPVYREREETAAKPGADEKASAA